MFWLFRKKKHVLTILVADDDKRYLMTAMEFQSETTRILTASTQEEAREMLRKHCSTIDVFILDGGMPGTDYNTKELLQYAKNLRRLNSLLVASSAFSNFDLIKDGCDLGLGTGLYDELEKLIALLRKSKFFPKRKWRELSRRLSREDSWERSRGLSTILQTIVETP